MNATETLKTTSTTSGKAATGRLFYLEASGGQIHSANADGSDRKVIVSGARVPDGVVVDLEAGHIYWTNMGVPSKNDGSIERVDLDGKNRVTIVGEGKTFTPKQLHLEKKSGKLYWCDREGMRVMREPGWFKYRNPGRYKQRRRASRYRPNQMVRRHHC